MVVLTYLFIINNYIGNADKTINADGIGYYDYLPSILRYLHPKTKKKRRFFLKLKLKRIKAGYQISGSNF